MRIASLVPSATEMCFALGLGDDVVAVTHECDHPAATAALPRLTRSCLPAGLEPAAIDAAVRERIDAGESLYALDAGALAGLEPDLIVTQQVCAVCAVSCDDVRAVAAGLPSRPAVLSLDPARLDDVLADAETLAAAAGSPPRAGISRRARSQPGSTRSARRRRRAAPRVAAIEWLDPPYRAGHWLPEMIAAAGGIDALAAPGERSQETGWDEIAAARPDVVVVMPCGLDADAAEAEARRHAAALGRARRRRRLRRRRRRVVLAAGPAARRRRRAARAPPPPRRSFPPPAGLAARRLII